MYLYVQVNVWSKFYSWLFLLQDSVSYSNKKEEITVVSYILYMAY